MAKYGRAEPGQRFAEWTRRYILFHGKQHPRELGVAEVESFLKHIAQTEKDPLHCLEEAHEALEFLYVEVLHIDLGELPFPEPPRLLDRLRRAIRVTSPLDLLGEVTMGEVEAAARASRELGTRSGVTTWATR